MGTELAKKVTKAVIHKNQQGKQTANMATRAHTQAHGKASPCSHPAHHEHLRRLWTH